MGICYSGIGDFMTKTKKQKIKQRRRIIAYIIAGLLLIMVAFLIYNQFFSKKGKEKPDDVPAGENGNSDTPNQGEPDNPNGGNEQNPPTENPSMYGKYLNRASGIDVDKDMEQVLFQLMDLYYQSLKELKVYDMMSLFAESAYEEAYLNQIATSMIIESRKMKANDLSLSKAKYDIIYKSATTSNGVTTIKFLENSYLSFNFMTTESKIYDIECVIKLKKGTNGYEIVGFDREQDGFVMFTNLYTKTPTADKGTIKAKLDALKAQHMMQTQTNVNVWRTFQDEYLATQSPITMTCDHSYDRDAALTYVLKYVTTRNPDWPKFDDGGGNCQNYASQMLYTGGIPMDITGSQQWKYYSSPIDTSNSKTGRSASWAHVGSFYNYARYNTGFGLCSKVDVNPYYAEAGDVGQVGYADMWNHTVVVVGTVKDKNGKVIDVLLNSNTVNLENYPLTAYVYPKSRIIKVFGWND